MRNNKNWFSLIEILVWILIISGLIIAGFQTLSSVWVAKVKLIEKTQIEKEAYFAAEKLFEMIKKWWTLDYEEYWNRYNYNVTYASWSFLEPSWFWNFWHLWTVGTSLYGERVYHCISNGSDIWTWGCLSSLNIDFQLWSLNTDMTWESQRYSQYSLQFIDRNSDNDSDSNWLSCVWPDSVSRTWVYWDENCDWSVIWDDDDLFLWEWPVAFSGALNANRVWELYLINNSWNKRTYFRWNVWLDPNRPIWSTCTGTQSMTGTGCLWTVEFLELTWADYWYDHDLWIIDIDWSQNDWLIDTWLISSDFTADGSSPVAGSNTNNYWQNIFPPSIHVSDFKVFAYPNIDLQLAWKNDDQGIQISPYIGLQMTLQPSWANKRKIRGTAPSVDINTVIWLTELEIK